MVVVPVTSGSTVTFDEKTMLLGIVTVAFASPVFFLIVIVPPSSRVPFPGRAIVKLAWLMSILPFKESVP